MLNYIKKLFSIPFEPTEIPLKNNPLSAKPKEIDVRDIPFAVTYTPKPLPVEYKTDVSAYPQWYQMALGTCVSHAMCFTKMVIDHKETGKINDYSKRFHYALSRRYMGAENESWNGMSADVGAKVICAVGSIVDPKNDDSTLSHMDYVNKYQITSDMLTEANIARAGGYADIDVTVFEMQQAVIQLKAFPVTVKIDFSKILPDGTILPPKTVDGWHEITCIGYDTQDGGRFIFKNWWQGYETMYVRYADIEKVIVDATAIKDIPNDLVLRAKEIKYIFLNELKPGSKGEAVAQLQKRLKMYGVFPEKQQITTFYGGITTQAVRDFQKLKGLSVTGNFGPLTKTLINQDAGFSSVVKKSKLDLWCESIIKMEGAKPEINNPGHLRYIGQASAIGKDYRGFAIFPDYATGYGELRKMLIRAATGGSKIYKPTDTLLDFFGKYAPSSDGNAPDKYAAFSAKIIGVDINTQISSLLV